MVIQKKRYILKFLQNKINLRNIFGSARPPEGFIWPQAAIV